jgi:hypothetical protein
VWYNTPVSLLWKNAVQPGTLMHILHRRLLIALLIGVVALLPRTTTLHDFLTFDEAYHWIGRTERFHAALVEREWAATRQTGHPGVTLMWLGSLGLALEQAATPTPQSDSDSLQHLAWMRLPSAVLHAVLVALGFLLLLRLVAPPTALLAGLFWATSPFLIAHARLLHMDALLTDFVVLCVLCVLIACRAPQRLPWLLAAGVLVGLALLTKGPALMALPMVGLLLFWQLPAGSLWARLRLAVGGYLLWLGVALLVVVALWPALWVTPQLALERYVEKIVWEGGNPFTRAQFFMGQSVTDPGLLFYPVVYLFRTTPLTMLGVLLLPLALRHPSHERATVLALAAVVLFWVVVMSTGAKKFDRYVLPTWPLLLVLAAAGWAALLARVWAAHRRLALAVGGLLSGALLLPLIGYHPHYLSYYNPLAGGGAVAQQVLLIGWGEGNDVVGDYLRSRTDIAQGAVLATDTRLLQPFVPVPVKHITVLEEAKEAKEHGSATANYVVVDRAALQRNTYPHLVAQMQQQSVPLHHVVLHGIEYAVVYQLPRPYAQPVGADFGAALHLHGVTITRQEGRLVVLPSWGVRRTPAADYWVFLHLLDAAGTVVAQSDTPPGGAEFPPSSAWQPGQQIAVPLPLVLPPARAEGEYRLVMGLYDVASGERVRLEDGSDTLLLGRVRLPE